MINWGIIGAGNVCEIKSGPAFYKVENSSLVAVMRRDENKVKDFAQKHNVAKWYTNADDLINDPEINAVYIATPPYKHKEYTIKSLKARKPVYVEKPMALNFSEAQEMVNMSKETGIPLFVAYYRRWFPYFLKIKKILDNELIGKVLAVNLTNILPARKEDFDLNKPPWHLIPKISGGGYFFDLACHQLDILDFLLGPIENAKGEYTNRAGHYWVEDTLSANLKFESGVLASCVWSYVGDKDNSIDRIEMYGTKGMFTFSISSNTPIYLKVGKKQESYRFEKPKHVEMPMIEKIVGSLLGTNSFSSNMESAARTSLVMDRIMGQVKYPLSSPS